MNIISVIGTIASLGSIPLAIYIFVRNKENLLDKARREIVKLLSFQIGSKGFVSSCEVKSVINSKLRESKNNINKLSVIEIVEDLTTEIISNPLIDNSKKELYLGNLQRAFHTTTNNNETVPSSTSIVRNNSMTNAIENESQGTEKGILSSWISIIGVVITVIVSVLFLMGSVLIESLFDFLNNNQELSIIIMSLLAGVLTLIIALIMQKISRKRKKNKIKKTSHNGRFGASWGVSRPTLCVEQPLPLSSKPQWNPPPAAKPLGR